ncbi:MAG: FliA/WhiG family RNA polymerase sigma factor [Acidimicrobiales bacterium]
MAGEQQSDDPSPTRRPGPGRPVAGDTDALWAQFIETRDDRARAELIVAHMPLVRFVVSRLLPSMPTHVHADTLVDYGVLGLMEAVDRFDPDRGFRFETFAVPRIRGAIVDEIRSIDWTPRSVRSKARAIAIGREDLEGELHRTPSHGEIAARTGLTTDEIERVLAQIQQGTVTELDESLARPDVDTAADPAAAYEHKEQLRALHEAVAQLRDRERLVVELYYFEDYTLSQIGAVLGVTEGRVSQIHSRAIGNVMWRMRAWSRPPLPAEDGLAESG